MAHHLILFWTRIDPDVLTIDDPSSKFVAHHLNMRICRIGGDTSTLGLTSSARYFFPSDVWLLGHINKPMHVDIWVLGLLPAWALGGHPSRLGSDQIRSFP